jgi:hypothetical protein
LDAAKINTFTLNADALSRIPEKPHCKDMKPDMDISKLPCGACKYSAKAHQNWTVFAQEIDDVVPLGMSTHSEQLSETANVYAALSYLFSEDQEKYEDTDSSLPLHSTIDIICSAQEVSNEVETDDSRKVYVASRTDGLAGVDYSVDEILKFQQEDPDLELVIPFLRTNQNLLEEKLVISSKAAKKIWLNKDMFFLDEKGILRNIPKKQGYNRLVVPRKLVQEVLSMCHDLPASGHQGTSRTYARVKEKY